jgi:putative membrane-bound dehydrogenase-like protein
MLFAPITAAEPRADAAALPRSTPLAPAPALAAIEIRAGLKLELVASEPLVLNPIAMSFDEDGRLYVVEMLDYPSASMRPAGRIRRLEDTDGDGKYDRATVFADRLAWPSGVFCYNGGVFVAATPEILHLRDSDGDGKADGRDVVFTGFGTGVGAIKSGQLVNGFAWGLDNRIYAAAAGNSGRIRRPDSPAAAALDLRNKDFSFDPRTFDLRAETGTAQFGHAFDDFGRRYMSSNHEHLRSAGYEYRYAERSPLVDFPPGLTNIARDGGAAELFRISPEEPWRVMRMNWRIEGKVRGGIEAGGRTSGYFTSACGVTIYRGDALGAEFYGNAFVADPANNIAHRKIVREAGTRLLAERPADEQKTEFIRSRDRWFRPVNFATAPDGTLYVADMYRELIEDPMTIPEGIVQHLDLAAGNAMGRIYRVVPAGGFKQPAPPRLSQAATADLVAHLDHPNGWYRDTALRLLYERQDMSAGNALGRLARESERPATRIAALTALQGIKTLGPTHLAAAIRDRDPHVREHAIRLVERIWTTPSLTLPERAELRTALQAAAMDSAPRVRTQVAFTLGSVGDKNVAATLLRLARQDSDDELSRVAILSSLGDEAGAFFVDAVGDTTLTTSEHGRQFIGQLIKLIGARGHREEIDRVIGFLAQRRGQPAAPGWLNAFGQGLRRAAISLATVDPGNLLAPLQRDALGVAADRTVGINERVSALQLIGMMATKDLSPALLNLLTPGEPQRVQTEVVSALGRSPSPSVADELLARWPSLTPQVREEASRVLLARADRALRMLEAVRSGRMRPTDLSVAQQAALRRHADSRVSQLAATVLQREAGDRHKVVQDYLPALELSADAGRGRQVFLMACQSCHRLGGDGFEVGPDLATVKNGGKEKLLTSILDPNRDVDPRFTFFKFETTDAGLLVGTIVDEAPGGLRIKQVYGVETSIARTSLISIQSLGQSMMPENLEQTLTRQNIADLLEYIVTADP